MNFQWAEGYHPPKGVTIEQAAAAVLEAKDPDTLLRKSRGKRHCLHNALWSEKDQVWANRARREYCRKFIGAVKEIRIIGGDEVSIRAVEFVKVNGGDIYATIDDIMSNQGYLNAYLGEIQKLQQQAINKMAVLREITSNK